MSTSKRSKKSREIPAQLLALVLMLASTSVRAAKITPEDFGIELQNKLTAEVLVAVRPFLDGRVEYAYTVRSGTQSLQDIRRFHLQTQVAVPEVALVAAPGWFVASSGTKETLDDGSIQEFLTWNGEDIPMLIKPGRSLAGFKLTVKSLPGVQDFQIQGHTDKDMVKMDLSEEESDVAHSLQNPFKNNSFKGKTVGPDPVPEVINLAGLIDRLVSLKHQSASIGWLGNAKFVQKLDKRLDQAKAALARDKKKLARVRLSQFVHELTKAHKEHEKDHRDKHEDDHDKDKDDHDKKFVNDEAFQLLKINAEFIIAKLPEKPKDKDEEKECREAEHEKENED